MSIRAKILLLVLVPIFTAYLAVELWNGMDSFREIKALAEYNFLSDTECIARRIGSENAAGLALSKSAAAAAEQMFGKRSSSVKLIRNLLDAFPQYAGASVGYETNADFNDAASARGLQNIKEGKSPSANGGSDSYEFKTNQTRVSIDEWIAKTSGGRFAAYWIREKGEVFLEPLVDMDKSMYSAGLKKKVESSEGDTSIITEPYLYNNKTLMVEYASAIVHRGRFSGQVAFDRDLDSIDAEISAQSANAKAELFLLSAQARIISSTKAPELKTLPIGDLQSGARSRVQRPKPEESARMPDAGDSFYRDVLNFAFESSKIPMAVENPAGRIAYFKNPESGIEYCAAFSVVRPGNWVLVQIVPSAEIYEQAKLSLAKELAGGILFAAAALLIFIFSGRAFGRIDAAIESAANAADGNFGGGIERHSSTGIERRLGEAVERLSERVGKFDGAFKSEHALIETSALRALEAAKDCLSHLSSIKSSLREISEFQHLVSASGGNAKSEAETAKDSAAEACSLSESERGKLSELRQNLEDALKRENAAMRRISSIKSRSQALASIAESISKVADETGLLSLNASVEAEKAGEAGSKFAGIAREIGRLSERAAESAKDIENIASDIGSASDSAASANENARSHIGMGEDAANSAIDESESLSEKLSSARMRCERIIPALNSQEENASRAEALMLRVDEDVRSLISAAESMLELASTLEESNKKLFSAFSEFRRHGR